MTVEPELLTERRGPVGRITLNRPGAANAVSTAMWLGLVEVLGGWAHDADIGTVVIAGAGEGAFCAGGDVRAIRHHHTEGISGYGAEHVRAQYTVHRTVATYAKPIVTLADGVALGGGCALTVHGSSGVLTERTRLGMPENAIGLYPDAGATYVLPRCPGEIGTYLGLTGTIVAAADALYAGLGTAFVPSERIEELASALIDGAPPQEAVARFAADPGPAGLAEHRDIIDHCFARDSVADILAALDADGGDWARQTAAAIAPKCPFSLEVCFHSLRAGRALEIDACMTMEYRISVRMMARADFLEGVRATVVDKDQAPLWSPDNLAGVDKAALDACFAPLADDLRFDAA